MELVYNKSKPVAVTGMAFPTGDVNNFVVGSEEGTVYTACRHGRWFSVFLPVTFSSFLKVCYRIQDYNYLALWERYFWRNAKHHLKFSLSYSIHLLWSLAICKVHSCIKKNSPRFLAYHIRPLTPCPFPASAFGLQQGQQSPNIVYSHTSPWVCTFDFFPLGLACLFFCLVNSSSSFKSQHRGHSTLKPL